MEKQAEAARKRAVGMLSGILTRQTGLHREMLALADAKRDSIIKGDLEKLERVVADEKKLVAGIEDEEQRRLAVMALLKTNLGLDASTEKLSEVILHLPEAERVELAAIREELKAVLEECQMKTRHNAELLKTSLEHVETFLRSIGEAASRDASYRRNGKRSGGGPTIIDRSI